MIYYVRLAGGRCGLSEDRKEAIMRRLGTENVLSIEPATKENIEWVRSMGGYVPERARKDQPK